MITISNAFDESVYRLFHKNQYRIEQVFEIEDSYIFCSRKNKNGGIFGVFVYKKSGRSSIFVFEPEVAQKILSQAKLIATL